MKKLSILSAEFFRTWLVTFFGSIIVGGIAGFIVMLIASFVGDLSTEDGEGGYYFIFVYYIASILISFVIAYYLGARIVKTKKLSSKTFTNNMIIYGVFGIIISALLFPFVVFNVASFIAAYCAIRSVNYAIEAKKSPAAKRK